MDQVERLHTTNPARAAHGGMPPGGHGLTAASNAGPLSCTPLGRAAEQTMLTWVIWHA